MSKEIVLYSVLMNTPLTHAINQLSWEAPDSYTARVGQILKCVAGPIDKLIQAILLPVFVLMLQYQGITSHVSFKNLIEHVLITPIALALALLGSIVLIILGIAQCFFPFKAFYGVSKGKEAVYEYVDLRLELQRRYQGKLIDLLADHQIIPAAKLHLEYTDNPQCESYGGLVRSQQSIKGFLRLMAAL